MKIKNTLLVTILSISSLFLFGQYNQKTEYSYLKLINNQNRTDLIKDNFKSAEIAAENFILSPNNKYSSLFFNELSKSYNLSDEKELAFYYNIVQRVLFPDILISNKTKNTFFNNAYSNNLCDSIASDYWEKTSIKNLPETLNHKIILIIELSVKLYTDELTSHIYSLGLKLRQQNFNIPAWYQHWEFLSIIGFNENQKRKLLKNTPSLNQPIYKVINDKRKLKIYSKAIRYYIKTNAVNHATELLNEYKNQDLSIFRKFDVFVKKLRIKLL